MWIGGGEGWTLKNKMKNKTKLENERKKNCLIYSFYFCLMTVRRLQLESTDWGLWLVVGEHNKPRQNMKHPWMHLAPWFLVVWLNGDDEDDRAGDTPAGGNVESTLLPITFTPQVTHLRVIHVEWVRDLSISSVIEPLGQRSQHATAATRWARKRGEKEKRGLSLHPGELIRYWQPQLLWPAAPWVC